MNPKNMGSLHISITSNYLNYEKKGPSNDRQHSVKSFIAPIFHFYHKAYSWLYLTLHNIDRNTKINI